MLKKLLISAVLVAAAMSMVASDAMAQRRPPPGWNGPGFNIYIGPGVRRWPPPPPRVYRPIRPPPVVYGRGYCNVPACAATYLSFRRWDCSYQPYYGPRRRCTIP